MWALTTFILQCSDLAWKLSAFSMDVVDPLAIWTGIGTGNEDEGIKMVFIQDIVGGRDPEHCVLEFKPRLHY